MLLADLVATVSAVSATRARSAKIAALAELLTRLEAAEVLPAVGLLTASPRQGRLGVGWGSLARLSVAHADAPLLEIVDVDTAFAELAETSGSDRKSTRLNSRP